MFVIRFRTDEFAPDEVVVLRSGVDGWAVDVTGEYRDGAWTFRIDEARYGPTLEFKFVLGSATWMDGPNLVVQPVAGGEVEFDSDRVTFAPAPATDDRARRSSRDNGAEDPLRLGVAEIFRTDDVLREAVTGKLKDRGVASRAVAERAGAAFADFSASRFSQAERDRPTYWAPGDDLTAAMEATVTSGVDAMRESSTPTTLRLVLTDDLKALLQPDEGGDGPSTIDLATLFDYITRKPGAAFSDRTATAFPPQAAETEAERMLAEIEQPARGAAAAASHDGADTDDNSQVDELVDDQVTRQMTSTTSPEGPVLFNVPQRSDQETRNKAVETFELRDGPSDVTSYHDFTALHIAFAHVWTEIFDGRLRSLGQELYQEYVKLKIFAGADDGADPSISTLTDLSRLMGEIRELSRTVQSDLPTDLRPPGGTTVTASTPAGSGDLGTIITTALDPASIITDNIKDKTIRTIVNPAGALIDALGAVFAGKQQLTWESFPGPLPLGNDIITFTVEENVTAPGTVEIVLRNSPEASWWKGIHFREFDATNTVVSEFKISNDPRDTDVWDPASYNVLPLYTPQVTNAVLEFDKAAMLGVHTGFYLLARLDEKLHDRARVTFTWIKDQ